MLVSSRTPDFLSKSTTCRTESRLTVNEVSLQPVLPVALRHLAHHPVPAIRPLTPEQVAIRPPQGRAANNDNSPASSHRLAKRVGGDLLEGVGEVVIRVAVGEVGDLGRVVQRREAGGRGELLRALADRLEPGNPVLRCSDW